MSIEVVFWYSEEIVNKAYFVAESEEQGRELLRQVQDGEIFLEDLPEFYSKSKNYEATLDEPQFYPRETKVSA